MAFYLDSVMSCTRTLLRAISGWVPRHLIGAVLVSLPAVSVFSHVTCDMHLSIQVSMSILFICPGNFLQSLLMLTIVPNCVYRCLPVHHAHLLCSDHCHHPVL